MTTLESELPPAAVLKEELAALPADVEEAINAVLLRLGEAEALLRAAGGLFRNYQIHHLGKLNTEKATRNGDMANLIDRFLLTPQGIAPSPDADPEGSAST